MGRSGGLCQEVGKTLEECRKKQGRMAEVSEEGLGSKWAVVPVIVVYYALPPAIEMHLPITFCRNTCSGYKLKALPFSTHSVLLGTEMSLSHNC